MEKVIQCSVMTPEKTLYNNSISAAVIPVYEGFIGILPDHEPIVTSIGTGALKITDQMGDLIIALDGGILEFSNNTLNILADDAVRFGEIPLADIESELQKLLDAGAPADRVDREIYNRRVRKLKVWRELAEKQR